MLAALPPRLRSGMWFALYLAVAFSGPSSFASAKPKATAGGSKACSHTGFYSKKVVPLCERHFPDEASKHVWVVQYYHPYVRRSNDVREGFEQLAAAPDEIAAAKV